MKVRAVVYAPEAQEDLNALYDRIAEAAAPATAIGYIDRIEAFCSGLSVASERGQLRNDIRPGLRTVGFERRITIAFAVEPERVVILRLFYGGRDWEELIDN